MPRSLRVAPDGWSVEILDQTRLPQQETWQRITTAGEMVEAIGTMRVRGAPLIGIAGAYALCLALRADDSDQAIGLASEFIAAARPTAVNLAWAVQRIGQRVRAAPPGTRVSVGYQATAELAAAEVAACRAIGDHGLDVLRGLHGRAPDRPLQVMTHCNAGWLATLEYGTALAPVYRAWEEGLPVHVWVSETRPRSQGWLTAWELGRSGVPHTVIADNAAGHLLQRGQVDVVLVGTDRTTRQGDVCNKIGTLLKALAAREYGVPFYVAAPSSSIDWQVGDGRLIPIEERSADEVLWVAGSDPAGGRVRIQVSPAGSPAANPAFDVTPAALVTGLITERGLCGANAEGLLGLFPEHLP
jgi:methylthioribose-1-phosphate isomerase